MEQATGKLKAWSQEMSQLQEETKFLQHRLEVTERASNQTTAQVTELTTQVENSNQKIIQLNENNKRLEQSL